MSVEIKCPHCGKLFEPSQAFQHDLEESLLKEFQKKYAKEKERLIFAKEKEVRERVKQELIDRDKKNAKLQGELTEKSKLLAELTEEKNKLRLTYERQLKEVEKQIIKRAKIEAWESASKELKDRENQISSLKKRAERAEEQELKIRKEKRELEESKRRFELEKQRQLDKEREKIRSLALKEAQELNELKNMEKEKIINDLKKALADAQRKAQQGSQQLQGEVQEIKLEELLSSEFPYDEIKEVPKGVSGADVLQIVRKRTGTACGAIIWESKRTKHYSPGWIRKLKEDQRAVKAELAVLVSAALPQNITSFGMVDGVLVTDLRSALSVAYLLRQQLVKVHSAHVANDNKTSKAEVVYNYLISNEFKQRIDVWVEYLRERREKITKEKIYFNKKWQEEEKSIYKLIVNTSGIYGDLQGLIGSALPKISNLELPGQEENDGADV